MHFWIIIPQLAMDMTTRSASTALATRLAWAIIEKKLNSMQHSMLRHVCERSQCLPPETPETYFQTFVSG